MRSRSTRYIPGIPHAVPVERAPLCPPETVAVYVWIFCERISAFTRLSAVCSAIVDVKNPVPTVSIIHCVQLVANYWVLCKLQCNCALVREIVAWTIFAIMTKIRDHGREPQFANACAYDYIRLHVRNAKCWRSLNAECWMLRIQLNAECWGYNWMLNTDDHWTLNAEDRTERWMLRIELNAEYWRSLNAECWG